MPAVLPGGARGREPASADSVYPDRRLAGSGVAFKLACLILAEEPGGRRRRWTGGPRDDRHGRRRRARSSGENRAIARLGLDVMRRGPRPGWPRCWQRAGLAADAVDLEAVAFTIAPRLNAAGRVGEAAEAARLLLAEDPADAAQRAEALETANTTRKDLMKTAVAEARALLEGAADAPAHARPRSVVRGDRGLVAARLAEDRGRPAVVGAELGDVIRASCRSDGSLDLGATLEACSDLFVRHGGHAGAAGFELPADRWAEFMERFTALAASAAPAIRAPCCTSISCCPRSMSTTRCIAISRASRRLGRATRSRSWPSSASPRPACVRRPAVTAS